jgi:T-complex protein 1 subunit alpha
VLLPLPQILVELAELQDQEVGDGTTSVVIVAAELLKRANELVRAKIHPTSIISGYRLAMREVRRGTGNGAGGNSCSSV